MYIYIYIYPKNMYRIHIYIYIYPKNIYGACPARPAPAPRTRRAA